MKIKINLNKLLNQPDSRFEKFHDLTKQKKLLKDNLDPKKWHIWKAVYYKGYTRLEENVLPKPKLPANFPLIRAVKERHSSRKFTNHQLSKAKLSTLLYYSAGLKNLKNPSIINRFYPSAGARYPLEVYFLSINSDFPKGLYHYYLKNHSLETLFVSRKINLNDYFNQSWIAGSSGLILISAVFKRNTNKYGDRGYRHVLMEAGHLGQNIYLISSALHLSCCAVGGFHDDKINKLLDIDGVNESVLYIIAIGNN